MSSTRVRFISEVKTHRSDPIHGTPIIEMIVEIPRDSGIPRVGGLGLVTLCYLSNNESEKQLDGALVSYNEVSVRPNRSFFTRENLQSISTKRISYY